jgi:hypothetical protein
MTILQNFTTEEIAALTPATIASLPTSEMRP